MGRLLTRWLLSILLAGVFVGTASAQVTPGTEDVAPRTSVLPYALALLFTLGVLVILCMPSRKS